MPLINTSYSIFLGGLVLGSFFGVLLWLQLPGQTPQPPGLSPIINKILLGLTAGFTWYLWSFTFGAIGAFFCLGGWSMVLLCLLPIFWAITTTYRSSLLR